VKCELDFWVGVRGHRVERTDKGEREPAARATHARLGGDIAAASGTFLVDERLTEPLRQPLTYQARRDVRTASGREANNDAHRPRRIGLRDELVEHLEVLAPELGREPS